MDIVLQICIPGAQGRVGEDETRIWRGNSPAVQWLGVRAASAGGTGSIPGQRTGIPYAEWCSQKKKNQRNRSGGANQNMVWLMSNSIFSKATT